MKLVTASQMQKVDRTAIDERGIPSDTLMENAGSGIAERILTDIIENPSNTSMAVFCGKGNNGGDGLVIARHLHHAGVQVSVFVAAPPEKLSKDARGNYNRASEAGVSITELSDSNDLKQLFDRHFDLIVDAVFGTGFTGAPRGITADMIGFMNSTDTLTVAVDLPSGLNADNGEFEGEVVSADQTYTLALPKIGLFVSPGRELAGHVEVVPIGIPDDVVGSFDLKLDLIDRAMASGFLPMRPSDGHKGIFGKVLLVAGSKGMTGAAMLAGESALRTGCGLARIACPESIQPVIAAGLREVTTHALPEVRKKGQLSLRALGEIRQLLNDNQALILGPGLGLNHETQELARRLLSKLERPAIVDADALTALTGHTKEILGACPSPLVLTPHPGEFMRLTGEPFPSDFDGRLDQAKRFAANHKVVLVLKGSPTLVCDETGHCYLNPTGNDGMATGGSGDVLSGIIGSFLAQGLRPTDAAVAGVYIHGLAGDLAAHKLTPRAMIAGDIIGNLSPVFDLLE